jgi:hypothetical protein
VTQDQHLGFGVGGDPAQPQNASDDRVEERVEHGGGYYGIVGQRTDRVSVPHRLARHHQELFEEELNGWYTDPALWPRDRSLKMLQGWCSFELHTVVVDAGESQLEDDEFEE